MEKYKIYQSDLIKENHLLFQNQCKKAHKIILNKTNTTNSTWVYTDYNIFNITSSSILFYKLYKELNYHIRSFIGDDRPLWFTSWLNYDEGKNVEKNLQLHSHSGPYHGYISITPQYTQTHFNNGLVVDNKIGQIYMGPGDRDDNNNRDWDHYVKITKPYDGVRITLGFDINFRQNHNNTLGYIPLL